jgi:choline dehydrogenase-like flavoprotein
MHIDLNQAPAPGRLTAEICVVGGGAAGITVARQLLKLGHDVMLLESGGLDYEPATAALNAGSNVGENYYELQDARLRLFGGTTAIWGGRIAQLDPIDLESRPWVPHSGWPICWAELARYYPAARKIFDIPEQAATVHDLTRSGVRVPLAGSDQLDVGLWDFDRRFNRFQFDACRDLATHRRCTLLTHATVTGLNLRAGGHDVESLTVRSLQGQVLTINPRIVILAAGGVENPRLLLASRDVAPTGVGNDHGLVGRFFMEHPHARGGRVIGAGTWDLL